MAKRTKECTGDTFLALRDTDEYRAAVAWFKHADEVGIQTRLGNAAIELVELGLAHGLSNFGIRVLCRKARQEGEKEAES